MGEAAPAQISGHTLNPERLQTQIMSEEDFDPSLGDIYIPEDMRPFLDKEKADGGLLGPSFQGKRMVLMGPQGVGKTSFFNRLTGSTHDTSSSWQSCTTRSSTAFAQGPASELQICDTPGTADTGMKIEEAFELRKAVTRGTVSQIVVVVAFPNVTRAAGLSDLLVGALDKIFSCDCFQKDMYGTDLGMRGAQKSSPQRTRAFVVVTHRDQASVSRADLLPLIEGVRAKFPWVGPVALIDPRVSIAWIYDTIVACAGYQLECCTSYEIPLVDMFARWELVFDKLDDEWMEKIADAQVELQQGMLVAIRKVSEAVKHREAEGEVTGNHVDRVAPTLDAITRFMDDLYENITQKTLAQCYETTTEQLWAEIDPDINNARVNTLNVIRQKLAPALSQTRKKILDSYPVLGDAAVYKACGNCGAVYVRPTGCNWMGHCGKGGVDRDSTHNGTMTLKFQYEYDNQNGTLELYENEERAGFLERQAWNLRTTLHSVMETLPVYAEAGDADQSETSPVNSKMFAGCGKPLHWSSMRPLTRQELVEMKLVQPEHQKAVQLPCSASKEMSIETFLRTCGDAFLKYEDVFKENSVKKVKNLIDGMTEADREAVVSELVGSVLHKRAILDSLSKFV